MAKNIEPKLKKIGDYLKLEEDMLNFPQKGQGSLRYSLHSCRGIGRRYSPTHEIGNPVCCRL